MTRNRFLRAAVHLRRWKRRPKIAVALARVRQGSPFAASLAFNLLVIITLAMGYSAFHAKGLQNAGIGERVVTVRLFDAPASETPVPEIQAEETEEPEEASVGAETLPEGEAVIETGEATGDIGGETAPEEDLGEQVTASNLGVAVPSVALPEVDAGEGRPDGIVGVDCYRVFDNNQDKALECAGRDILSGWRAELARYDDDWARFAGELGTANRQIRYGPLRAPLDPQTFGYPSGLEVPKEVQAEYERQVAELRRRQLVREFGRDTTLQQEEKERIEEDMDASTYSPTSPGGM